MLIPAEREKPYRKTNIIILYPVLHGYIQEFLTVT